jgi:subtilisin family serine protease
MLFTLPNLDLQLVLRPAPVPLLIQWIVSSSRGPSRYPGIVKPDVLAPGVNILGGIPYQAGDGGAVYYGIKSGTSMAVPHVSGAAILLKRLHRSWSPTAIK